ncbi:MAG: hypothetical protein FJ125_02635 [Deltaproteobacteria bacterium]|nr:hypothetical protein [Deltaproteobacteria bacterium]
MKLLPGATLLVLHLALLLVVGGHAVPALAQSGAAAAEDEAAVEPVGESDAPVPTELELLEERLGEAGLAREASGSGGKGAGGDRRTFTLSWAPLLLLGETKVGELIGELRLGARGGVALVAGIGSAGVELADGSATTLTVYEIGGQLRWYALGRFDHGVQLGVELLYVHTGGEVGPSLTASGTGLAVGPFLGYKLITGFGLTFEGQLGFQSGFLSAEASSAHSTVDEEKSEIGALVNLSVGWSF